MRLLRRAVVPRWMERDRSVVVVVVAVAVAIGGIMIAREFRHFEQLFKKVSDIGIICK